MAATIIAVHSDEGLRAGARDSLRRAGHVVYEADELAAAWRSGEENRPDLVLIPWSAPKACSRGELLRRAWQQPVKARQRTVDVHVRRLRQALEPYGCEPMDPNRARLRLSIAPSQGASVGRPRALAASDPKSPVTKPQRRFHTTSTSRG